MKDQCGGTQLNLDGISLGATLNNATGQQLTEQFNCGSDYSPKARKPYTITKQRERWTEEEHKKFIEALKLYGRAWRQIEEHVGSKTAVQIRSHAQKFFSKVVRESGGGSTCSVEPIEIPPPRPKRKPTHPYPRKLTLSLEKELIPEKSPRSSSLNFSISEQVNQSPTSVLSAVGSDTLGSTDSDTPNHSLSPVSFGGGVQHADSFPDEDGSPSVATTSSVPDEQFPKVEKLDSYPKEIQSSEEPVVEGTSTRSLKLFGRTVFVTECHKPFSSNMGTSKLSPLDAPEEKLVRPLALNNVATKFLSENGERTWRPLSQCFMQFQKENSIPAQNDSAALMPWWTFHGTMSFPHIPFHKQEPAIDNLDSKGSEVQDKEIPKEVSWTGSNSGSVSEGENVDKNMDAETESQFFYEEKELSPIFVLNPAKKSASSGSKVINEKCPKGFVPYKKRIAERDSQSSTISGEEREGQRIRLCL
ncbi:hypothetical protein SADUNF_Sadunf04G0050900 [Salix dunnii]|uniref:Uncharacterized protein n=1 Tax=Salix dunnii TaxID=1413687 RepID=A0A835K625_9ROSI|nr:hypothetical protein SADUNF_Sadunf04G0050900 [Salix dunnii]